MNPITFPLKPDMAGAGVVDLQDVLRLLLEKGVQRFQGRDWGQSCIRVLRPRSPPP